MVNHPASRGQNWKSGEPIDFIVQINFSEVFGVEKIGADKNSIKFGLRLSSKTEFTTVVKFGKIMTFASLPS